MASAGLRSSSLSTDGRSAAMQRTTTAIGTCSLQKSGHLLPCDSRHAPIKFYRSYGEWWEAGVKVEKGQSTLQTQASRFWPYGQDVTKVYQTNDRRQQYQLDDRIVDRARPYIPPRHGSVPDMRTYRLGGSRNPDLIGSYTSSLNGIGQ